MALIRADGKVTNIAFDAANNVIVRLSSPARSCLQKDIALSLADFVPVATEAHRQSPKKPAILNSSNGCPLPEFSRRQVCAGQI